MADGYRYPQQSAGNYYFQTQPTHPRHQILRTSTPPNNIRSFNTDTPSPSRSPDSHSPAQHLYGMYNQGQHQGQHGRVNGGRGGMPPMGMYPFHQSSQHAQHHANIQQDHNAHTTNGSVLGHHPSYSGGGLTSSTPSFTPQSLQNGHTGTTRGGQPQQMNEHWGEQLKLHKASSDAHSAMIEQHAPQYYARLKAGENRGISGTAPVIATVTAQEGEVEDRGRPSNLDSNSYSKRQDWHNMDMSGLGLRVLGAPLFNYTFMTELYVASNKIQELPASIGQLRALRHLDASNNLLKDLPPELGMCVYLKNLFLFDNQLSTLPNELGSLHQLDMLGIEGNAHMDQDIRSMIMDKGTKALIHELRESAPVPLPPQPRAILDLSEGTPSAASQERFKVFSYNVLCEKAATPQQYGYTPSGALAWDFRKEQILQDITSQDADIVCLQEVDNENFKEYFSMKLAYADYKGVYWPRPRSKTMSEKDAKYVDGCATFYKGSKYILLDKQIIDIANIAINRPDMKNQHDIFNRVMPRDHIAVITFFENRQTGARFIVVNNHLFWDPVFADVKLIQIAVVMEFIKKEAERYARMPACKDKKPYTMRDDTETDTPDEPSPEPAPSMEYTSGTQIPMILCTDLNSTADSAVYELLSTGSVAPDHKELAGHSYGNFTRDGIEHPFSLRSAYTILDGTADALTFTNYTPGFQGIIDHIWYSTNTLEVTSLLSGVDQEYIKRVPGFPNYHFPSDHLSLLAEFSVKGRKEKKAHAEPDFGPSSSRNDRRRDRDN